MRRHAAAFTVVVLFGLAPTARASEIVYDNGLPDQTSGLALACSTGSFGGDCWTTDDFVLLAATTVTDAHFFFLDFGWDQALEWAIYADAGGEPGGLLATGDPTNVSTSLYCLICMNGFDAYSYSFDFDNPVALAPGDYWFALLSFDPNTWFWATTGGALGFQAMVGVPGNWEVTGYNTDLAFSLTSAAVPEPAALLLLAAGLSAAAVRRRLKTRA